MSKCIDKLFTDDIYEDSIYGSVINWLCKKQKEGLDVNCTRDEIENTIHKEFPSITREQIKKLGFNNRFLTSFNGIVRLTERGEKKCKGEYVQLKIRRAFMEMSNHPNYFEVCIDPNTKIGEGYSKVNYDKVKRIIAEYLPDFIIIEKRNISEEYIETLLNDLSEKYIQTNMNEIGQDSNSHLMFESK